MKKYSTPDMRVIYFNIEKSIMDGYKEGDTMTNPWEGFFTEKDSQNADL